MHIQQFTSAASQLHFDFICLSSSRARPQHDILPPARAAAYSSARSRTVYVPPSIAIRRTLQNFTFDEPRRRPRGRLCRRFEHRHVSNTAIQHATADRSQFIGRRDEESTTPDRAENASQQPAFTYYCAGATKRYSEKRQHIIFWRGWLPTRFRELH